MYLIAILLGRSISYISRLFHVGAGATWSGEIALWIDPHILPKLLHKIKKGIIIVAGTNGKTTTTLMINKILEDQGFSVLHNESGANLLNGIVSSFFVDYKDSYDYAVFEVDENTLPKIITEVGSRKSEVGKNFCIVLLNLFRDQLDRYGEVDTIADKWLRALRIIDKQTNVIINGDDPHLAFIGKQLNAIVSYFGLDDKTQYLPKMQHATDTIFCPSCGERLTFSGVYFSHLGDWKCLKCNFTHPKLTFKSSSVTSPIEGVYNTYNTLAATLVLETVGVDKKQIENSLKNFTPAFGRMEEVSYGGKNIKILLSKNPTGFNESLRTVLSSKQKGPMMLLLNDRIPDGTDVSWIWDVDFEILMDDEHMMKQRDEHDNDEHPPSSRLRRAGMIIVSGDRYLDMAMRLKYAMVNKKQLNNETIQQFFVTYKHLNEAVLQFTEMIQKGETGWILATYSAMLNVRKILTGKKIL